MNIGKLIKTVLFSILTITAISQVRVGEWRNHSFYSNGQIVVNTPAYVYVTNANGIIKFNKQNNEIEDFSKISGLNDVDIRSAAYNPSFNYLILGYANGNIDIINENKIFNINDIKNKPINAEKSINAIAFCDNYAYLGCGFGIVVFDLIKKEIKETWLIGDKGRYLKINDMDISPDKEYIYVASNEGIYKGNLNRFLADYSNWEIITDNYYQSNNLSWISGKAFTKLVCFNDKVITNYKSDIQDSDTVLSFYNNTWDKFPMVPNNVKDLHCNKDKLLISLYSRVLVYDINFNLLTNTEKYCLPNTTVIENDDVIWIADNNSGLIKYNLKYNTSAQYAINGPDSNNIFDLYSNDEFVYGVAGGMNHTWTPTWQAPMIYKYTNQRWTTISRKNTGELYGINDIVSIVSHPKDPNRFFCGSWIYGLVEFRDNKFYKLYDAKNAGFGADPNGWTRICGLAFDKYENLWVVNSLTTPLIHVLKPDGTWKSIDYSTYYAMNSINSGKIIITRDNIKWVIVQSSGLFVFDDNNAKKLNVVNADGEIFNDVLSIAEDNDGYIWVGTSKGVLVYYNPQDVFKSNIIAQQIKIPRKNNTNEADLLLANESVTAIVIDGANKKWFGTRYSGVFYTNYNGTEEIYNFNTENSPLIDNSILCMTIPAKTGEVFFGTSKGIQSFRNIPTKGNENYDKVYAFPNPVEKNYDGLITITGLMTDSYVKITDIAGNLVFEIKSEGGQAIWDGKDRHGNKVKTGIYLVFSTIENGEQTNVTKIMFIN